MINSWEVQETNEMIEKENLDGCENHHTRDQSS